MKLGLAKSSKYVNNLKLSELITFVIDYFNFISLELLYSLFLIRKLG
jgi:hypothetical protein